MSNTHNTKKKKYEIWNHIRNNGDSIYPLPFEVIGGQIYVSEIKIRVRGRAKLELLLYV